MIKRASLTLNSHSLALAELRLILTHMLFNLDMAMIDETDTDWASQKEWLTWEKKELMVGVRKRKDTACE